VFILLAFSSPEVFSTTLTLRSEHIFRGLAEKRDCHFRCRSSDRLASGIASLLFMSGSLFVWCFSILRYRLRISGKSSKPFGLVCHYAYNPTPSATMLKPHPPARLTRSNGVAYYIYSKVCASAGKTICGTHQPHPVQRLPRPTGLPAHYFSQSDVTAVAVTPASQK